MDCNNPAATGQVRPQLPFVATPAAGGPLLYVRGDRIFPDPPLHLLASRCKIRHWSEQAITLRHERAGCHHGEFPALVVDQCAGVTYRLSKRL